MANNPVQQDKGDGIERRCRVFVTERIKEIVHRAVNSDIVPLGIVTDGNSTEQNGQDGTQQIKRQRIHAKRLEEPRPAASLTLNIHKVDEHGLYAHRHAAGNHHKRG